MKLVTSLTAFIVSLARAEKTQLSIHTWLLKLCCAMYTHWYLTLMHSLRRLHYPEQTGKCLYWKDSVTCQNSAVTDKNCQAASWKRIYSCSSSSTVTTVTSLNWSISWWLCSELLYQHVLELTPAQDYRLMASKVLFSLIEGQRETERQRSWESWGHWVSMKQERKSWRFWGLATGAQRDKGRERQTVREVRETENRNIETRRWVRVRNTELQRQRVTVSKSTIREISIQINIHSRPCLIYFIYLSQKEQKHRCCHFHFEPLASHHHITCEPKAKDIQSERGLKAIQVIPNKDSRP